MPIPVPAMPPPTSTTQQRWIDPGAVWPDDRGNHIQAHGGGVVRVGETFYWFGEDRSRTNTLGRKSVACYSSTDLVNWTFRRQVVADLDMPPELAAAAAKLPASTRTAPNAIPHGPNWWVLERPKVFHNTKTGKFVMYAHVDDRSYRLARVGVFVSDTVDGQYRYLHSFRPLGQESRDIGQFVDTDGSAYLIFEARPTHGFYVAKLSDDFLDVAEQTSFIKAPLEGGAVCHVGDTYYCVGSYMTGWAPNDNQYATAKSVAGPWSPFHDIAPPKAKTYGSQSTFLLTVAGTKQTDVIYVGDQWKPRQQWDSRYLWMPMDVGGGQMRLPPPRPWTIDVTSGVVTFK